MHRISRRGALPLAALLVVTVVASTTAGAAVDGLVRKKSPYSVTQTIDRLDKLLRDKGLRVFTRIRHSANAKKVGTRLRPTELLVFGNPRLGTQLMTAEQTVGIDLPMKALAWRDSQGQVWLAYTDPAHLARRHGIDEREAVVQKMRQALAKLTDAATREQKRAGR
jgi:uncharacterized protein (DUF302 family)